MNQKVCWPDTSWSYVDEFGVWCPSCSTQIAKVEELTADWREPAKCACGYPEEE